jgi:conjugal transfer ATP-binding protein TraC
MMNNNLLFSDEKGTAIPFDIFSINSDVDSNGIICGRTGSGKTVFAKKLATENMSKGHKIRIVDIGRSYHKFCGLYEGKYIDFANDPNICLNPFSNIIDIKEDIAAIVALISLMIYTKSGKAFTEVDKVIVKYAIWTVYETYGTKGDIDKVYEVLKNQGFEKELRAFTSEGEYGRWFNGPANFDIANDDLVVFEMEGLKAHPKLFEVITLQVIRNLMATKAYPQKQLIIFEEVWQLLGDSSPLVSIFNDGYLKNKSYQKAFICIIQSIMDLHQLGELGAIIADNSSNLIVFESGDFEEASKKGIFHRFYQASQQTFVIPEK